MSVEMSFGRELPQRTAQEVTPSVFKILVLADFGSTKSWGRPQAVDCDDLDDVMQRLGVHVKLQLPNSGPSIEFPVSKFEEFHPDELYSHLELFGSLRSNREKLLDPTEFADTLHAMRTGGSTVESSGRDASKDAATGADVLSQAIDRTPTQQAPLEDQLLAGTLDWDAYVRQLVAPYLVDRPDPLQAEMVAKLDETIADSMRQLLHQPAFQQLEATWTGVRLLTQRLDTGRSLQIAVLPVSFADLQADLEQDELQHTELYRQLITEVAEQGEAPWSLIVGDYNWSAQEEHCRLLGRIARICSAAGAAFVSGANPQIAGCGGFDTTDDIEDWTPLPDEVTHAWNQLRELTDSERVVLTLPRIIGRRVYGAETDPIESFAFEEFNSESVHDDYLWINAAYGLAVLSGQDFLENGASIGPRRHEELDRLPIHCYQEDGEECLQACAEAFLTDRIAARFADLGLTVARSVRNDGAVRFEQVRSLSRHSPSWKFHG